MSYTPYARFTAEELILRDHLAMDRTILANERTFLAYIRTALTLFAAGASFHQFFDSAAIQALAWILIPAGLVTFAVGFMRYRTMRGHIHEVQRPA